MTDAYTALLSEIADIARRIGPARTPESIREDLEEVMARHQRWASIEADRRKQFLEGLNEDFARLKGGS